MSVTSVLSESFYGPLLVNFYKKLCFGAIPCGVQGLLLCSAPWWCSGNPVHCWGFNLGRPCARQVVLSTDCTNSLDLVISMRATEADNLLGLF